MSELEYWKQRCQLAEKIIYETPCDPDIHMDQMDAWSAYRAFIGSEGDMGVPLV